VVLGRDDLARYATFADRRAHRDVVIAELAAEFRRQPTAHWVDSLREAGVPAQPVNDVAAALADPQVAARDGIAEVEHPALGTVRHIASPLRVPGGPVPPTRGPFRGEHTDALLSEARDRASRREG
jgi:crotonobetainyl-CoA:carnitine CoA-transferase CaiB-like acyl-CoA transferase